MWENSFHCPSIYIRKAQDWRTLIFFTKSSFSKIKIVYNVQNSFFYNTHQQEIVLAAFIFISHNYRERPPLWELTWNHGKDILHNYKYKTEFIIGLFIKFSYIINSEQIHQILGAYLFCLIYLCIVWSLKDWDAMCNSHPVGWYIICRPQWLQHHQIWLLFWLDFCWYLNCRIIETTKSSF